jgi:hypothetical protein
MVRLSLPACDERMQGGDALGRKNSGWRLTCCADSGSRQKAGEAEQWPAIVERESDDVLLGLRIRLGRVLSEAVGRDQAAVQEIVCGMKRDSGAVDR